MRWHCGLSGEEHSGKGLTMLRWAVIFLLIALVAGALGAFGVQGLAMNIAWTLFVIFLILFVVALITGRRINIP
jgi:uncharacterized membrane protein YtjA (UPF0391 family)